MSRLSILHRLPSGPSSRRRTRAAVGVVAESLNVSGRPSTLSAHAGAATRRQQLGEHAENHITIRHGNRQLRSVMEYITNKWKLQSLLSCRILRTSPKSTRTGPPAAPCEHAATSTSTTNRQSPVPSSLCSDPARGSLRDSSEQTPTVTDADTQTWHKGHKVACDSLAASIDNPHARA